jgi:hypothetical protein
MDRRSFLKNSIGALLFGALTSNKALASVVDTLAPDSPKVLLYLVQLKSGEWKVRVTKWVDVPTKRLNEPNIIKDSFKPLDVVDIKDVTTRRLELWKEYNCSGRIGHLISIGIPMDEQMKNEYGKEASKNHTGKKRSDEIKQNISKATIGRTSPRKGVKVSQETKNKMSQSAKIKIFTEEHRNNIRKATTGEKNPFYGKTHTKETKQIIRDKHPSKIKVTCEHCSKELDYPNYKRYHGIKCKKNVPHGTFL